MNALETALVTAMNADNIVGGLNEPENGATGGFHQLVAPQNTGFPRCRFQKLDRDPLYSFSTRVADRFFYQIAFDAVDHPTLGDGAFISGKFEERAIDLFTDGALSVSGKTVLYSRFFNSIPPLAEWDVDNNRYVYSKGIVVQLWLA